MYKRESKGSLFCFCNLLLEEMFAADYSDRKKEKQSGFSAEAT